MEYVLRRETSYMSKTPSSGRFTRHVRLFLVVGGLEATEINSPHAPVEVRLCCNQTSIGVNLPLAGARTEILEVACRTKPNFRSASICRFWVSWPLNAGFGQVPFRSEVCVLALSVRCPAFDLITLLSFLPSSLLHSIRLFAASRGYMEGRLLAGVNSSASVRILLRCL